MNTWAIVGTAVAAAGLAAACGSSSSDDNRGADSGGGGTSSSGGQAPVPLEAGSLDLECHSASDCTAPQLCCGTFGVTEATSTCATGPCPTGGTANGYAMQLCASATECPSGNACLPTSELHGVSTCEDDDSGIISTGPPAGDGGYFVPEASAMDAAQSTPEAGAADTGSGHPEADASSMDAETTMEAGPHDASADAHSEADASSTSKDAGPHDAASGG